MTPEYLAAPLEWHPWYRSRTHLLDWLNGEGPHGADDTVLVRVLPPVTAAYFHEDDPPTIPRTGTTVVMTRRKAYGLAPYVGRPFAYWWTVGVDQYGRQIASDSHIHYLED